MATNDLLENKLKSIKEECFQELAIMKRDVFEELYLSCNDIGMENLDIIHRLKVLQGADEIVTTILNKIFRIQNKGSES